MIAGERYACAVELDALVIKKTAGAGSAKEGLDLRAYGPGDVKVSVICGG